MAWGFLLLASPMTRLVWRFTKHGQAPVWNQAGIVARLGGAELADAVCQNVRLIRHATSLGGVESTMERRAAIPGQGHLPPSLLRLSVGIEDAEDLWVDLDSAIRSAAP